MKAIGQLAGVAAMAMMVCAQVEATDFPAAGGSYLANVAVRLDAAGNSLGTATGTMTNCSTQSGGPADVINYGFGPWALQGMADANATATASITLDQVYTLNKIRLQYGDFLPATHELRASADGLTWTPLLPQTAAGSTDVTFSPTPVRYLDWQAWGPGASGGYGYLMEALAYISDSVAPPQKEDGYNLMITSSLVSQDGWISWAGAGNLRDSSLYSYSIRETEGVPAHALFDLGDTYALANARVDFAYGQNWMGGGKLELSPDLSAWTTVFDTTGVLSNSSYNFAPVNARYLRLTNNGVGGGAMGELEVFAVPMPVIPEPAAGLLLAAGIMLAGGRRGRRPRA